MDKELMWGETEEGVAIWPSDFIFGNSLTTTYKGETITHKDLYATLQEDFEKCQGEFGPLAGQLLLESKYRKW
jgi:hypothetical protein